MRRRARPPASPDARERLIRAAIAIVADDGFAAATMRSVAVRAACTTGSVTHHFACRQDLLVAMVRSAHDAAGLRMLDRAQAVGDPRLRLRAVMLEALPLDATRLAEWRAWLAFWAEAVSNVAIAEENARRYHEWRTFLASLVLPFCRTSQQREREVDTAVALIDGLGVGLTVAARARSGRGRPDATAAVVDRYLEALCGAPRP